ncbi:RNA 2',3'-cyclic phosphodiesterase [Sulfitobacter sp. JBTF-M27]|uniref:RNA 2',3'-cyclic phosphodiesterase n=1 Tax=Sulfitobacter sediminilitoris TaxID=2698830 RepID=A0A6P0CFA5_9RHOB|nr:RNA 2',3'-cyclic phosphodiesterase [Sulfitobacter sediminilitoris]NEK23908.1 RNA 2',3'-cyclic phosphodiesterase [Sulfitobacter sediminilitoris]
MRAFVAIDLPDLVRGELQDLQNELAVGRPVPEENFHLTLCFLGEQPEAAVEEVHQSLSSIQSPSFTLRLAGVGSFGKRSPQAIYADVAPSPELMELEKRITRTLRNAGLRFQKRRFRPHVTIMRLPKAISGFETANLQGRLAGVSAFQGSAFEVSSFQLYQSTLTPAGALHEVLASYELAGS